MGKKIVYSLAVLTTLSLASCTWRVVSSQISSSSGSFSPVTSQEVSSDTFFDHSSSEPFIDPFDSEEVSSSSGQSSSEEKTSEEPSSSESSYEASSEASVSSSEAPSSESSEIESSENPSSSSEESASESASSEESSEDSSIESSSEENSETSEESSSEESSSEESSESSTISSSEESSESSSEASSSEESSSEESSEATSEDTSSEESTSESSEQSSDESSSEESSEETSSEEPSSEASSEETSSEESSSEESSSEESSSEESSSEDSSSEESSSEESSSGESSEASSEESSEPSSEESSESSSESSSSSVAPAYSEAPDSLEGVDASDMSGLYNAFSSPIYNYTSTVSGYFNSTALYDYYRHYGKNYVQDNVTLFTQEAMYRYPIDSRYNAILNDGYLDHDDNAYSFSLPGENIDARLSSSLTQSDLNLVGENDSYHNHLFTLADLSQTFFSTYGFTRISKNKYQYARQFVTDKDNAVFNAFIDLCAPGLNNTGFFMTFSRVTVELNPEENVSMRLRLYAYKTQWGKLLEDHRKETYPNWYLLFSEAEITDIGATNIAPLQGLFE